MKKQCIVIKSSKDYNSIYNRHFCVDVDNERAIFDCIKNKKKKFWTIVERTLTQPFIYWDSYAKEKISLQTKNVSAIKFFDADNTRLYCQELSTNDGNFYIICSVELFSKKVQQNDKKIDAIIERVSKFEYEVIK